MSDPFDISHGSIPDDYQELLVAESFGHLATITPAGWPHTSPVWVDHADGEAVLVNTLRGRQKERNLRATPRAMISVADPTNPYRYLAVRGSVSLTEEGAADHIDRLARQYLDVAGYPHHDEESASRVIVRIEPELVIARGRSADR